MLPHFKKYPDYPGNSFKSIHDTVLNYKLYFAFVKYIYALFLHDILHQYSKVHCHHYFCYAEAVFAKISNKNWGRK